jgi:hypothetical protein
MSRVQAGNQRATRCPHCGFKDLRTADKIFWTFLILFVFSCVDLGLAHGVGTWRQVTIVGCGTLRCFVELDFRAFGLLFLNYYHDGGDDENVCSLESSG